MKKKNFLTAAFVSTILLLMLAISPVNIKVSKADIQIYADGSHNDAGKISRNGNIYQLIEDVYDTIIVGVDNVVIDGAGFSIYPGWGQGVRLSHVKNVTVKNINIRFQSYGMWGVYLDECSDCVISENTVTGGSRGFYLYYSSNNVVDKNNIDNVGIGIDLDRSIGNVLTDNNITNTRYGFHITDSPYNTLRGNHVTDSKQPFDLKWYPSYNYVNYVDSSNTINGAPIIYWVGEKGKTVPTDVACVILVNCEKITVQNLKLSNNDLTGIFLISTRDSKIADNELVGNKNDFVDGIGVYESSGIEITGNKLQNQSNGINLEVSSYCTIVGNVISNNSQGLALSSSSYNTVSNNEFTENGEGISANGAGNTIQGNYLFANNDGIASEGNNTISGNTLTGNTGAALIAREGSTLVGNNLMNNSDGIVISGSNNVLKNNTMVNNHQNLIISSVHSNYWRGNTVNLVFNDVDSSNTVNGKPVYCWNNHHDETVPPDAAYVILVNCTNITVQNLKLMSNGEGVVLLGTTGSTVKQNIIKENSLGIGIFRSSLNTIAENNITENGIGIQIGDSMNNTITKNTMKLNNGWAIDFKGGQKDNLLYLNNFVDNHGGNFPVSIDKMYGLGLGNAWDKDSLGNYWSNYTTRYPNASEIGNSGIGNTPFVINENNVDHYPLMNLVAVPELSDRENSAVSPQEPSITLIVATAVTVTALVAGLLMHRKKSRKNRKL